MVISHLLLGYWSRWTFGVVIFSCLWFYYVTTWRSANCFILVQQTPRFFLRFLKERKIDLDLFEHKYIEVSSLLRSQFIVHYFLIKPKFSTCSILPTIFEIFFFFQLLCRHDQWSLSNKMKQAVNGWLNLERSLILSR